MSRIIVSGNPVGCNPATVVGRGGVRYIRQKGADAVRFAVCNELFEGWRFDRACATAARLGYRGLEIAPFTFAPFVTDWFERDRKEAHQIAADNGLEIIGLHWLLARTTGFHLNSADAAVRAKTADYLKRLAECCADLGGTLLVFGSPAARKVPEGASLPQAADWAADTIRQVLPTLATRNVTLCLEPLGPAETDFWNTAAETVATIEEINHPNVRLHLDVKAMSTEATPIPEIIRRHREHLAHFHANDPNQRGPGMGTVDFMPIFRTLKEVVYDGWVSVEVFDFSPDPETIARASIAYMRRCWEAV